MILSFNTRISWTTNFYFSYWSFIKLPTWILHLASPAAVWLCQFQLHLPQLLLKRVLLIIRFNPLVLSAYSRYFQSALLAENVTAVFTCHHLTLKYPKEITSIELHFMAYIMSWHTVTRFFFGHCFWSSNEGPFMKVFLGLWPKWL